MDRPLDAQGEITAPVRVGLLERPLLCESFLPGRFYVVEDGPESRLVDSFASHEFGELDGDQCFWILVCNDVHHQFFNSHQVVKTRSAYKVLDSSLELVFLSNFIECDHGALFSEFCPLAQVGFSKQLQLTVHLIEFALVVVLYSLPENVVRLLAGAS